MRVKRSGLIPYLLTSFTSLSVGGRVILKKMNEQNKKEFDKYLNEQFELLKRHHERIMLRIWEKFVNLNGEPK